MYTVSYNYTLRMQNPGIRDIHGEDIAFDVLDTNLTLGGVRFRKAYVRDCSDRGRHPIPLRGKAVTVANHCFSGPRHYRFDFCENGAVWYDKNQTLWVELRVEKHKENGNPILLAFIWDSETNPKVGVSRTTYVTEEYWRSWQSMKK